MKGKVTARDGNSQGDSEARNMNVGDKSRKGGREGFLTITNQGSIVLK